MPTFLNRLRAIAQGLAVAVLLSIGVAWAQEVGVPASMDGGELAGALVSGGAGAAIAWKTITLLSDLLVPIVRARFGSAPVAVPADARHAAESLAAVALGDRDTVLRQLAEVHQVVAARGPDAGLLRVQHEARAQASADRLEAALSALASGQAAQTAATQALVSRLDALIAALSRDRA